jgi:hypothetical protein
VAGKVSGPGSGPPPVGGPGDGESVSPAPGGARTFAEKLDSADAARQAADPSAVARGLTADVAAELAAGRINAKAALDRVIERVVDKQLGVGAPAAVREKVRAALESAVADDPLLIEKIKTLGAAR